MYQKAVQSQLWHFTIDIPKINESLPLPMKLWGWPQWVWGRDANLNKYKSASEYVRLN